MLSYNQCLFTEEIMQLTIFRFALLCAAVWSVAAPTVAADDTMTTYSAYGVVFPPMDPSLVPVLDPNNATTLTLCELWENDNIPVTPGIEVALKRLRPHFALRNIQFRMLRRLIPPGCGDDSVLAVAPTLVDMHMNESKTGCSLIIGPSCTETMYNIRGLMENWNVPVVTSGASGIKFDDKKRTKVLTRFGYTQEDVSLFVIRILDHFNWTTVHMVRRTHRRRAKIGHRKHFWYFLLYYFWYLLLVTGQSLLEKVFIRSPSLPLARSVQLLDYTRVGDRIAVMLIFGQNRLHRRVAGKLAPQEWAVRRVDRIIVQYMYI